MVIILLTPSIPGTVHVRVYPQNQTVTVGENVTFYCEGNDGTVDWWFKVDGFLISGEQRRIERGFITQMNNVTIFASELNNNTELWCSVDRNLGQPGKSNHAYLIIIGKNRIYV